MSKSRATEDQLEPEGSKSRASDEPMGGEDTEGHMFQPVDYGTSRHLANSRNADIEREARDRQRRKEAEAKQNRR
jgi:hypothetical protein